MSNSQHESISRDCQRLQTNDVDADGGVVADADDKVEICVGNDTSCSGADGSDGCSVVSGISAISTSCLVRSTSRVGVFDSTVGTGNSNSGW